MSLCNFRIFTIILVLELAAFESLVEAFTIQRPTEATNSDLAVAESTHRLEVRNDLKSDVRPKEIKNDSPPLTVPIKTTAKTEDIQKNVTKPGDMTNVIPSSKTKPSSDSAETTTAVLEIDKPSNSSVNNNSLTSHSFNVSSNTTQKTTIIPIYTNASLTSHSFNVSSNTTQKTTIIPTTPTVTIANVTNATENNQILEKNVAKENSSSSTRTTAINITNNETLIYQNKSPVNSTNIRNATNQVNVTKNVKTTTRMRPISRFNATKLMNISNETKTASQVNLTKSSITNMNITWKNTTTWKNNTENNKMESTTEESNATSYSTDTVYTSTNQNIYDSKELASTSENSNNQSSLQNENTDLKNVSAEAKSTSELKNSTEELTGEQSKVTVIPYWKKYTTIERMKKRLNTTRDNVTSTEIVSSTETDIKSIFNKEKDLVQAGTAQTETSIRLNEVLNNVSGIPSLERLKNDLLVSKISSTTDLSMGSSESTAITEIPTNNTTQTDKTVMENSTTSALEITTQAYNIVSSKRAGFLDFSTRPVIQTEMSNSSQKSSNLTENYTKVSISKTTPRNPTSKTSQSQLVADAIKEELMKEEFLMDSVENAQRQQDDRFGSESKPTENLQSTPVTQIPSDTSTEDKLRVKPINADKTKNGSLYTVNPNYKPLKKIEVQPPKPFVRNPDDNSWRNESLSSLGIVFKANNSSKPFTQVLKNKTETEWNNLLDRYDKGDEPELRTRLEKIAEIRKSKKKKVNSLGETVYSDYEEGVSSEISKSTNPESFPYVSNLGNISSFLDEVEKDKLTTIYPEFDIKTSTVKAKKILDEYEEDDESDYTLPNIDIKKFITSTSTSASPGRPSSVLPIQLTSPIFSTAAHINNPPDRQPTLQYFPPIEKQQKVVINDYDTVFQKKINVFTTDAPRTVTTAVPENPHTPVTFDFQKNKFEVQSKPKLNVVARRPDQMDKNVYLTNPPHDQRTINGFVGQHQDAAGYNQASYVIKHLRDFIDEVVKADENSATDEPLSGVTVNTDVHVTKPKPSNDYYDYEAQFRKDVINRFAENFNQNSERFKADFPVLYNTSIVHSIPGTAGGVGGESTAFMKRLYEDVRVFQHPKMPKRFDPNCDHTVELSPAYELHYYVPEEEEKEEIELKTLTRPPQPRLHL